MSAIKTAEPPTRPHVEPPTAPATWWVIAAIVARELRSFVASPIATVVSAVFLAGSGLFFAAMLFVSREATVRHWALNAATLLLLFAPLLSMRSFAEEERSGTLDVILPAPVTEVAVVAGKYLGLLVAWCGLLLCMSVYGAVILLYGDPELGPMIGSYLGVALYGAAALAIGLLASSLTRNQVIAATVSFLVLLLLHLAGDLSALAGGTAGRLLRQGSFSWHLEGFVRGQVRLESVVYFASIIGVSLFATTTVIRRFRT